jgi:uncharacterized cupin superfamily protein
VAADQEEPVSVDPSIRVVRAREHDDLAWEVIPTDPGDPTPPGEEVVTFRAGDRRFSFGLWKRDPETGPMDLTYHEIAVIIEGEVEVTAEDGTVHRVGPGDVLITPKGTRATWRALSPVKKFWAVYQED